MTEAKFRGKVFHYGNDCGWVYGDFHRMYDGSLYHYITRINPNTMSTEYYNVESGTIGIYTGFKDSDGKEIYEGDIIGDWIECDGEMVESRETVFYDDLLGSWMLDQSNKQDRTFASSLFENLNDFKYRVIGNIYENPELLK